MRFTQDEAVKYFGIEASDVERALALQRESIIVDGSSVVYRQNSREPVLWERYSDSSVTATNHTVTDPDLGFVDSLRQINDARRWIEANSERLRLVLSVDDIFSSHEDGVGGIIFGPQDTAFLDNDLGRLGTVYDLGVRILQLTYQRRNSVGDGCQETNPGKLSDFGASVVREMDDMGIVIDLSHTSEATSFDAIEKSSNPVILSHAHPYELSPHMRAKSDDMLRAVADSGGVIGLTALSSFVQLKGTTHRPTVKDYMVHVEYLLNLVGPDHVGIGTDFDETVTLEELLALPNQEFIQKLFHPHPWGEHLLQHLYDATEIPNITMAMVAAGYDDELIRKILGGNFLRVFKNVWK